MALSRHAEQLGTGLLPTRRRQLRSARASGRVRVEMVHMKVGTVSLHWTAAIENGKVESRTAYKGRD